jgi:hypothetical protein
MTSFESKPIDSPIAPLTPLQHGGINDDEGFYGDDGVLVLGIDQS